MFELAVILNLSLIMYKEETLRLVKVQFRPMLALMDEEVLECREL